MSQIKVELQETMGSDRRIAEAAWTSSTTLEGKEKRTDEDITRVINMLANSRHSTPFESVVLRFWLKLPIATDRQFMTHRLQSASGMSGRYRTMPNEWLQPSDDIKEIWKKLGSFGDYMEECYKQSCVNANIFYNTHITQLKIDRDLNIITNEEFKRIREFYRGILPQHNMTERVSIMNLRAFSNFIKLRSKEDAQVEIREVANLMLEKVKKSNICPIALNALERNNWII